MDYQGQARLARSCDVLPEAGRLRFAGTVVAEIVEPRLPDCHDLWVLGQTDELLRVHVWFFVGIVRMGADRTEDFGKFFRDRKHLCVSFHASRDGNDAADAGSASPTDDGIKLGRKVREIEMAMAVDKHGFSKSSFEKTPDETGATSGAVGNDWSTWWSSLWNFSLQALVNLT